MTNHLRVMRAKYWMRQNCLSSLCLTQCLISGYNIKSRIPYLTTVFCKIGNEEE